MWRKANQKQNQRTMKLYTRLFGDTRTDEEKQRDNIRQMVSDYKPNTEGKYLSHSVISWYYGDKLTTTTLDYKPELNRKFH